MLAGLAVLAALAASLYACGSGGSNRPQAQTVAAKMPSDPPVHVAGQCSMAAVNVLVPTDSPVPVQPFPVRRGGAIPAGFVPVRAFDCATYEADVPGDGKWLVSTQRDVVGGLSALVAAYRSTTTTVYSGHGRTTCTLEADGDPVIAFVDAAGAVIWPAAPRDPLCDHITREVKAAVDGVIWKVTASQRTMHESVAGGCLPQYKNMLDITQTGPASPGAYYQTPPKRLRVCIYKGEQFQREVELTGADLVKPLAVLDAAPPAGGCTAQSTQFAVLTADSSSRESYLELDGCRRVGRIATGGPDDQPGLRQLDAAGVALLTPSGGGS